MKTQKKKSAKQKRVLIAAVVVAVAIVAGSTFAWFSSKDEVTNRLSASANYNVAIAEDFQAPEDWIPGQTINKDVAAVNAGNVDAFVRMWLGGTMRVLQEGAGVQLVDSNGGAVSTAATSNVASVTDAAKTKLGLEYSDGTTYYKVLDTEKINNPNDSAAHSAQLDEDTNNPARMSEVQTVQAGGVLVYAPAKAGYHWMLEQAADLNKYNGGNPTMANLPKDTVVGSKNSTASNVTTLNPTDETSENYYGVIDANSFVPESTGLYLFRRTIGETADGTKNSYEYSGYYYDAGKNEYFALHTEDGANKHSDYVLPVGAVTESTSAPSADLVLPVTPANVKLFTATETVINNLSWTYTPGTNGAQPKFVVKNDANATKPIVVDVQLANVGVSPEGWTAILDKTTTDSTNATTFYYNNDLEAGDTTTKLVDSVTLSQDTQNGAYLAFDFDLNVFMDSVQVTMTEDGKEGNATINPWAAAGINDDAGFTHPVTAATGTVTNPDSEIISIAWAKPTS